MSHKKKTDFNVTIGYKAVVTMHIKANSEEEAKKAAMEEFNDYRHFGKNSTLEDDSYKVQGVLNMTETWNML